MENAATMDEYKNSAYYQSLGIEGLQEQLAGYQTDEGALREQAENQYKPVYDAELQAIRQQLALQTQGYTGQLAGMGVAYDQQRRKTNQAYNESAVNLNNQLTKRGLGRSSLVSTQGAYLENQRNLALGDINASETAAINSINEKIALLTDQAAQNEKLLSTNYAVQIENRINELRQQNQSAATNLQLQIATLQQQGYQAYQSWLLQQQEAEFQREQFEYSKEQDAWQNSFAQNQFDYSKEQDAIQNALNQSKFDYEKELADRELALKEAQFEFEKEQAGSSGGSSGGGSYSSGGSGATASTAAAANSDSLMNKLMGGAQPAAGVGGALIEQLSGSLGSVLKNASAEQKAATKTIAQSAGQTAKKKGTSQGGSKFTVTAKK